MKTYAIVGTGDAPSTVITEGLRDCLNEDDTVLIEWGNTSPSIKIVYKYLRDNEIPFSIYYREEQTIPGELRELDNCMPVKSRYPLDTMLSLADTVLFLWDDKENSEQHPPLIHYVFDHKNDGVEVKELTGGLAPIVLDDNVPDAEPAPVEEDDDDDEEDMNFTREELEIMTAHAVKRYGQRRGCESKTKAGIIAELFGGEKSEEYTDKPSAINYYEEGRKAKALGDRPPTPRNPPLPEKDYYPVKEGISEMPNTPRETPQKDTPDNVPFEMEITTLIGNFFQHSKTGFNSDMAHLVLGQARLWMLKALAEG
jgi:hypothetical protein